MRYPIHNWIGADAMLRESFVRLARFGCQGIELAVDSIRPMVAYATCLPGGAAMRGRGQR